MDSRVGEATEIYKGTPDIKGQCSKREGQQRYKGMGKETAVGALQ